MGRLLPQASIAVLAAVLACNGAGAVEPAAPSKTVDVAPQRIRPDEPPPGLDPKLPAYTPEEVDGVDGARQPITSLEVALHRTFWTSPKLIAERERMRATDYRIPQARALSGPKLDFEASYGYERDNFEQPFGGYIPRAGWATLVSAVLTQPIYTFGRNAAAERTATGQVAYERAVLRYTEQQAMFSAIEAYAATLRDRAGVGIAADNLALLEKELSDTEIRFRSRETTTTDVDQVRTRVELGRAQKFAAERLAASSDARFLSVVGAPAGELAQPNPLIVPVATLEEAYAYAERHDPVIAAAYARERVSRAQRDATKADLMPRVDLKGRASYGTFLPPANGVHESQLMGQVVVSGPIFESGRGC